MDTELHNLASYKLPILDLLAAPSVNSMPLPEELDVVKAKIVEFFAVNRTGIERIRAIIGPIFTTYEIIPMPGVRVAKIKSLQDDLALCLSARINITDPIPGKGVIGIEVYNSRPLTFYLRSLLSTEKFQNSGMDLPITIGRTMDNNVFLADLSLMPHLLISGATGQGKSMFMHSLILSILYKRHPAEVKLILIDVKNLEFGIYRKIERHFLAKSQRANSIANSVSQAIGTLKTLAIELDRRYELLKDTGLRHVKEYNQKFIDRNLNAAQRHRYLPFIVVVIDEFADLITADENVDKLIARLAQLGRPAGIHLVIATQRPSVNIITGTIKVNFTTRLAFHMFSAIDSRTILDRAGAEALTENGDCLLLAGSDLIRLRTALINSDEIERVCDYIGHQPGYSSAMLLPERIDDEVIEKTIFDPNNSDPYFEEAARLIVIEQNASPSLLQRKLKLGYNRVGRIMDQLHAAGIVGPFEGTKAREVIIQDQLMLEQKLDAIFGRTIAVTTQPESMEIPHPKKKGIWGFVSKLFN